MQRTPDAAELLSTIADLLEDELVPALPDELRHRARVAGNLCRILHRELTLGPAMTERERAMFGELLGRDGSPDALGAALVRRLRTSADPGFDALAWRVLVEVVRDELAIEKPGYTAWEGT